MKKVIIACTLCLVTTGIFCQDKMNKKMDNKSDKMNKKMENPDRMVKKLDTSTSKMGSKADSARKSSRSGIRKVTR